MPLIKFDPNRKVDFAGPTNGERVARALKALNAYRRPCSQSHKPGRFELEEHVRDLMADLYHLVYSLGFDENHVAALNWMVSELWLRNFIEKADCPDYDTVINAAVGDHHKNTREGYEEDREYVYTAGDNESLHFNSWDAHGAIPPEFWSHVEIVTGRRVPFRPPTFSCSC